MKRETGDGELPDPGTAASANSLGTRKAKFEDLHHRTWRVYSNMLSVFMRLSDAPERIFSWRGGCVLNAAWFSNEKSRNDAVQQWSKSPNKDRRPSKAVPRRELGYLLHRQTTSVWRRLQRADSFMGCQLQRLERLQPRYLRAMRFSAPHFRAS